MDINEFGPSDFIRKPFQVKVVRVTRNNIEALAEHIGELKYEKGTPYIQSTKAKVGNTFKVWPGHYVTQVGKNKPRCYNKRSFNELYAELTDENREWVNYINGVDEDEVVEETVAPPSDEQVKAAYEELSPEIVAHMDPQEADPVEEVVTETPEEAKEDEIVETFADKMEQLEDEIELCEHGVEPGNCVYKQCAPKPAKAEPEEGPVRCEHRCLPGECFDPICDYFPAAEIVLEAPISGGVEGPDAEVVESAIDAEETKETLAEALARRQDAGLDG